MDKDSPGTCDSEWLAILGRVVEIGRESIDKHALKKETELDEVRIRFRELSNRTSDNEVTGRFLIIYHYLSQKFGEMEFEDRLLFFSVSYLNLQFGRIEIVEELYERLMLANGKTKL